MVLIPTLARFALDPSPDEARELLHRELLKREYQPAQAQSSIWAWLVDRFGLDAFMLAIRSYNWVIGAIVVAIVVALIVGVITRVRREESTVVANGLQAKKSSNEYRERALALRDTDPREALKAAFRALIALLDRNTSAAAPGRTVGDIARLVGNKYPDLAERARRSASKFDIAAYSLETVESVGREDVDALLDLIDSVEQRIRAEINA